MKRIGFISMLLAAVMAIFHGCQEAPLEEVKISLNKSLLVLEKGQTEKLSPTITPSSAAVDLTWSSADNSVAKVSTDGDVTGVAAGETVITVSAGEAKATCKVTVKPTLVEEVVLDKENAEMTIGDKLTLKATVLPADADDVTVTWKSLKEDVASVDSKGNVEALMEGSATIVASAGGKNAQCVITVKKPVVHVESVKITKSVSKIVEGESFVFEAVVTPADATDKSLTWESTDKAVLSIGADGKASALKPGKVEVIVRTTDGGKTDRCSVEVESAYVPVTKVEIMGISGVLNLKKGDTHTFAAKVYPEDATDKTITWSVSDEKVITVDQNGKVTAVGGGKAKVTVTSKNEGKTAECEVSVAVPVTDVILSKTSAELTEGDELELTITVNPSDATNKNVTWSSSDETVAKVMNGKVTALKPGSAKITVTTEDGGKKAECAVTVVAKTYPVTGVTLDKTSAELTEGDELVLTATITPSNATNRNVIWSSSNEDVAKVVNGKVTAMKAGVAKITVTTEDGGKKAECAVTVVAKIYPVTGVTLDKTSAELTEGDELVLTATIAPSNATNRNVTWSSSDETVVTVVNGKVTAMKAGSAKITVTTEDGGKKAECAVTVVAKTYPVTGVTLDKTSAELTEGDELVLTATITPSNATNKNVIWSSSDETVAKVVGGKVTALKAGVAKITVTTSDGGKTAECTVTVIARTYPVTGVALDKTSAELTEGDELVLTAAITPSNATNKNVTWSSSDETVAKVVGGKVTALKAGSARITVTTEDGGKTAVCTVTVKPKAVPVESVRIMTKPENRIMYAGDEFAFTAEILPANATDKTLVWSSSNTSVLKIDQTGKALALKEGEATVTVKSKDFSISDECTILVKMLVPVDSVKITKNPGDLTMTVGGVFQFEAEVYPENATDKSLSWASSNDNVLKIDPKTGYAEAKAPGDVAVVVKTNDGNKLGRCDIKVLSSTVSVRSVTISSTPSSNKMKVGSIFNFTAQISPENATNKTVTWSSDNAGVLKIDNSGKAEAISPGVAKVKAMSNNGKSDEVQITVIGEGSSVPVSSMTISVANGVDWVRHGKSVQMVAEYSPEGSYPSELKWAVSGKFNGYTLAKIDENGVLTATYFDYSRKPSDYNWDNNWPKVSVTAIADGRIYAVTDVRILPAVPEEIVVSNPPPTTMTVGQKHNLGHISILPVEAEQRIAVNATINSEFLPVENNTINAVKDGILDVLIQPMGNHVSSSGVVPRVTYSINVKPVYETALSLSRSSYTIESGSIFDLDYKITPVDATYSEVTWSSSNQSVASVDKNGRISAKSAGSATITATSHHGLKATCNITVTSGTSTVKVGDYYYSDGTTSSELQSGKTPVGVVFAIADAVGSDPISMGKDHSGCTHGLVVGLESFKTRLSTSMYPSVTVNDVNEKAISAGMINMMDHNTICGYSNTKAYMNWGSTWEFLDKLKEAVNKYSIPSTSSGWYLPSIAEFELLKDVNSIVNQKLKAIDNSCGFVVDAKLWHSSYHGVASSQYRYVVLSRDSVSPGLDSGSTIISADNTYARFIFAF